MLTASDPSDLSPTGVATRERRVLLLIGGLAAILGAFVRLEPVLTAEFPVLDGGLFYVMIREIQACGFQLPEVTSYNGLAIPFLYPPLSLYVGALLSAVEGIELLDLVRLLPAFVSLCTIPAFYLLARRVLRSPIALAAALASFCLLPTAFDYLIVGGGLPRAFGNLFSILTLYGAVGLLTRPGGRRRMLATSLCAGLTVLSHPVMAWFTVYSFALMVLFLDRGRRGMRAFLTVWFGAGLISAPWWLVGLARHGPDAFVQAFRAGSGTWSAVLAPFLFMHTNEPFLTLLAVVALLGLFRSLRQRAFLLPAWLGIVFLLEPRLSATYAVIPTCLLAGIGFGSVIVPGLGGLRPFGIASASPPTPDGEDVGGAAPRLPHRPDGSWVVGLAAAYLLVYLVMAAFLAAPREGLTTAQRQALEWIRTSTLEASRFAVVSGKTAAGNDYISEWFPALTGRTSLATPQGREWLPDQAYVRNLAIHADLQTCAVADANCLEAWATRSGVTFTHVVIAPAADVRPDVLHAGGLYMSLAHSPDYRVIYDTPEVTVFSFRPAEAE